MNQGRLTEQGEIVAVTKDKATVRIYRTSACGSCSACGMSSEKKFIDLEADNTVSAQVGDNVKLSIGSVSVVKVSVIVYLIPLVLAILALVIASLLDASDLGCVLTFMVGLAIGFCIVRLVDKRMGKSFNVEPIITEIIKENNNGKSNGN